MWSSAWLGLSCTEIANNWSMLKTHMFMFICTRTLKNMEKLKRMSQDSINPCISWIHDIRVTVFKALSRWLLELFQTKQPNSLRFAIMQVINLNLTWICIYLIFFFYELKANCLFYNYLISKLQNSSWHCTVDMKT